jgi:signal transduction histidine kinase
VRVDPKRIEQVLNNVLGNAIKFTPAGGVITLHAMRNEAELEISVHDSGRGIGPEHLSQIFEPFIRLNAGGSGNGLGLGLHIARKLVELHGGTIAAESDGPDLGTTFRIKLPANLEP